MTPATKLSIERDGFAVVPEALDAPTVAALTAAVGGARDGAGSQRRGSVYALRNLLEDVPEVTALADAPEVRALVAPILGPDCFPVRGILFDKTPEANWNVVWHQDLSIAVRERRDVEGFGPWSEKAGVIHVQPWAWVLERMLTVRLHLDDCDETNGPLLVLPGSHRSGRLTAAEIQHRRTFTASVPCPVPVGGALLMRPLLLHASSASQSPRHRRVIHLEYAAEPLPHGLQWHHSGRRTA
jgi:ectoine hydroxylase-related dioxygenase (phytanoyl-CoA dioxygenase family)